MTSIPAAKIALIGAGQIGTVLGLMCGLKQLGYIYLVDAVEGLSQGKCLDLGQFSTVEHLSSHYHACSSYEEGLIDADVVVVTAGVPRKPTMSRNDLLVTNAKIIYAIAAQIRKYCTNKVFVVCVTNPLDAMVQLLQRETKLPPEKVVGMGGSLDTARFTYFLSKYLNVSADSISTCVMGSHGDSMVPIPRYCSVGGIPLVPDIMEMGLISQTTVDQIIQRTRYGGKEIVEFLRTGSAFCTPACCITEIVEAYLRDKKKLLYCSAFLGGQYGINGTYVGIPVIIGRNGIEKIIELKLTNEENEYFLNSVKDIQNAVSALDLIQFEE